VSAQAGRSNNLTRLALSVLLLVGAVYVFSHRQQLLDQYTVWRFVPSSEIAAVSEKASFSDAGEFLVSLLCITTRTAREGCV